MIMNCAVRLISLGPFFLSAPEPANLATPIVTGDPKPTSLAQYPFSVSAANAHDSSHFSPQLTKVEPTLYSARLASSLAASTHQRGFARRLIALQTGLCSFAMLPESAATTLPISPSALFSSSAQCSEASCLIAHTVLVSSLAHLSISR